MAKTVEAQANELREMIAMKLGDLADELLERPAWGTPEWLARTEGLQRDEKARKAWHSTWHLAKIQISREAGIDPTGDVINARKYGATWQSIADACGFSRQRAYERWSRFV